VTCTQDWTGTLAITIPCALPVQMASFTVNPDPIYKTALLNWSTASEINNDYFEIQHSTDGVHFSKLGVVKGKGNSSELTYYSYTDLYPSSNINYYRIVQYDYDGKNTISEIKTVSFNEFTLTVSPNPSEDDFKINVFSVEPSDIIVYDLLGSEVYRTKSENGSNLVFGKELAKGTYILKYISATESKSLKLEKR
jgi:hypothetical protein